MAVSPGIGFGEYGEGFVASPSSRPERLRQAARNIKSLLSGRNDVAELRRRDQSFAAAS